MPRIARQRSSTGIYHIMLRGVNRQEIFHDDEDSVRFPETAVKRFIEYNEMENEDKHLDNHVKNRFADEKAREEIRKAITGYEIAKIKSLPKLQIDEIIGRVKKIEGLTQRQISRKLGISLSLINRA